MIGSWRKERLETYQLVSRGSAGPSRAYPVAKLHRCSGRLSVMLKDGVKKGRLRRGQPQPHMSGERATDAMPF
jgi:hypothetical protein